MQISYQIENVEGEYTVVLRAAQKFFIEQFQLSSNPGGPECDNHWSSHSRRPTVFYGGDLQISLDVKPSSSTEKIGADQKTEGGRFWTMISFI